jgi:hypothetical protein
MGYAAFLAEENFLRFLPLGRGAKIGAGILTMQKRSMAHRASLTQFLFFSNQLSSTEIADSLSSPEGALSRITHRDDAIMAYPARGRDAEEFP